MKELWNKVKTLWASFRAWKYSNIALWSAAGVAIAAVAVVIVLCAVGPKGNDNPTLPTGGSSMDGTNPTGGENTVGGGETNNGGSTNNGGETNNGGSTNNGGETNNGGSTDNGGSTNNGDSSNNGGGSAKPPVVENDNTNSSAPPAPEGTVDQMEKVVAVKTSTAGGAITAHPGGRITYTITITNNNKDAIGVTVTDTLPEGASLVRGCDTVSGKTMTWKVNSIAPGATHNIIYTVKPEYTVKQVRESTTDIIIKNTAARVQDKTIAAPSKDIWVLPTFNDTDRWRMAMAIDALTYANLTAKNSSNNPYNRLTLISAMYLVGFSSSSAFGSTDPDVVLTNAFEKGTFTSIVPSLYGGVKVPSSVDSKFRGTRATAVTTDDLICGDVIIVNKSGATKVYIYDGVYLVEVSTTAVTPNIDPKTVLQGLPSSDKYLVSRQSFNISTSFSLENDEYYNDYDKQEYTELEKALVATAQSYLLRGDRTQYDDGFVAKGGRFESLVRAPEDYTVDQYGYLDCSHFTYDLHWSTYGYAAKAKDHNGSTKDFSTCANMLDTAKRGWNDQTLTGSNKSTIYYYEVTGSETEAQKEAIYQKYISLLRPGDIVTYRYAGETGGHAMLYIGNGLLIHCTGSGYSNTNKTDTHEAGIRFMNVDDLFDSYVNSRRYMFGHSRFGIIRPQNLTTPTIPDNTKNRVANMQGIVGEKITSTAMGKTVNPGDEITYTFYVFNTHDTAKTVTIKDVLSQHVTFVSATNSGSCSGSNISWTLNVPANTRISVSYKVKVNSGVAAFTAIDGSKATINGVTHKCIDTIVANTLTEAQQQQLVAAVNTVKGMDTSSLNNVQVANLIYKTAFGVDNIFGENVTNWKELLNGNGTDNVGIFNDTKNYSDSKYMSPMDTNTSQAAKMLAPGMYGGNYVYTSTKSGEAFLRYTNVNDKALRSRYFWEKDLVIGDIFLSRGTSQETLFIYIGNDTFVALGDGTRFATSSVSAKFQYAAATVWYYEAVLRPSMALNI